ncbi:Putative PAS domain, signal transduction response regulator, receiver domain, CheY-like superfamily [Septoria linicola]|uniref:PAS domain, signal transduction response regulator, receiver domain, CheY-like superfamily n=1 Tax=Septoria linicola TaxID=215465 RepID=A0A9Q9EGM8_9PEZI|nr:putative PAS domain, signal transduction response regulator, receiver domain, CheY-like superfamily [Septoria linicola]USW50971.1 Putative PAS domain, signal transduction response regulator, receiver domain, CheY-like superfamily [Septoria linicola]
MPGGVEDTEGQWVLAACVPATDNEGNVLTVSGCLTDIAAQKQSQSDALKRAEAMERAYASEKRFSTFADQANIGIWILNKDSQLTYANKEWFRITNHPLVDHSNVDWTTLMDSANLEIIHSKIEEMRTTKSPLTFEFELLRLWADGQGGMMKTTALAAAYPELSDTGDIITFAGTLTDITHLRWAERLQKLRTDEAVEAKRQQEHFIDMTCHEIRNPLGAALHCADLARSSLLELGDYISGIDALPSEIGTSRPGQLWDSTLEAANIIISCCAHQRRIVDDILTLSKLDSKLLTIAPAPVKLSDMLTEVTRMFEVDAQKADVVFKTATDSSLEILDTGWAVLDRGRLMQVLINLITNSLKFTQREAVRAVTLTVSGSLSRPTEQDLDVDYVPAGIARDRVRLDSQWGSGQDIYLCFKVSDTGCGFNDEQKGRIFERFSQASPRTHSKYGGSGLGLFISREMIELQSGEIGVSSRPGYGSTFAFYVAARVAAAPPVAGDVSTPRVMQRRSTHENGRAKYTILVVEDNLVNQKVLRMQLQKLGHIVHVVSNGVEALQFLETTLCWDDRDTSSKSDPTIDLSVILMDMEMPVMGGIECARRIRGLQNEGRIARHLPIISVSANARDAQVGSALECGMDDAISKPFRVADLMPKIAALVDS